MDNSPRNREAERACVILRAQQKFARVRFGCVCANEDLECSLKTAMFELKRRKMTLLDVQIVDFDQSLPGDARRQFPPVHDAVFAAGLPDAILDAAKARRLPEFLANL